MVAVGGRLLTTMAQRISGFICGMLTIILLMTVLIESGCLPSKYHLTDFHKRWEYDNGD
jgi:hypothetical protein